MITRNQKILRALQRPNITYKQIGNRFGITRERVRQIRNDFIKLGLKVSQRHNKRKIELKNNATAIELLKIDRLSYEEISKRTNLSKKQLQHLREIAVKTGHQIPKRLKRVTSQRKQIIDLLKVDTSHHYGKNKRIAKQLGIKYQYVLNTKCWAKNNGLL